MESVPRAVATGSACQIAPAKVSIAGVKAPLRSWYGLRMIEEGRRTGMSMSALRVSSPFIETFTPT